MLRKAVIQDLPELLKIYNYEVLHGVATFDEIEQTYEERKEWFDAHQGKYLLLVKEKDGKAVGYASVSKFFAKPAYDISGEVSVYVDAQYRGQGIGKELLVGLLEEVQKEGEFHSLFSLITSNNKGSKYLHEQLGFEYAGCMKESGKKFGTILDVDIYRFSVKK